jgi:hypothetical protein
MPTPEDGRMAINKGNWQYARLIFEAMLQENPRSLEAWLGLAQVLTENDQRRICYENALFIDKHNQLAREGLRNLEPKPDPLRDVVMTPDAVDLPADQPVSNNNNSSDLMSLVATGVTISFVVFGLGSLAVYLLVSVI